MEALHFEEISGVWQQLARRNGWQLVADEAAFLAQVEALLRELPDEEVTERRIRVALYHGYNQLLYRGIFRREERACAELLATFFRLARREVSSDEADECAQAAFVKVLEKLPSLRQPQSLIAWALRILRTVQRDQRRGQGTEESYQGDTDDDRASEPADPGDLAREAEQRMIDRELIVLLRGCLRNDLEFQVIMRMMLFGDKPRDVATSLGLPLYRARVAKSRALQHLRDDEQVMRYINELVDEPITALVAGAQDDES